MAFTFNLITEHWIPCIRADDVRIELGLRETLAQAHLLREIRGDTPLETAVLHRLLLAVLHRKFGPKNATEWRKLWQRREQGFDMGVVDTYLQQWQHKFDLFDDRQRFMQAQDARVSDKPLTSLVIQMASGNNGTLFDHHLDSFDVLLSPAQAARALLVSQAFGIGGLSGLPEKFTDAPCAKGILFLAQGRSLMETLVLNMVEITSESPLPNEDDDCPVWEREDAYLPARTKPRGYLDYLTWQNRKVWLSAVEINGRLWVDRMRWAPGLRLDASDTDPQKQYIGNDEEGWSILCFRAEKALWRDSATLLQLGDRRRPPRVVQWLGTLASQGRLDDTQRFQLIALGMAKDRASLEFLRAETLPLPVAYLQDQTHVSALSSSLGLADKVSRRIHDALFTLAHRFLKPNTEEKDLSNNDRESIKKLASSWHADQRYWSQLEVRFNALIEGLPANPDVALHDWQMQIRQAANATFDYAETCIGTEMRAQRARALARDAFDRDLNFALSIRNGDTAAHTERGAIQ